MCASGLSYFFLCDDLRLMVQDLAVQFVEVDAQGNQKDVQGYIFHAAVAESRVSQTVLQLRKSAFRLDGTVDPMIDFRIGQNVHFRLHPMLLKYRRKLDAFLCGVRMISCLMHAEAWQQFSHS